MKSFSLGVIAGCITTIVVFWFFVGTGEKPSANTPALAEEIGHTAPIKENPTLKMVKQGNTQENKAFHEISDTSVRVAEPAVNVSSDHNIDDKKQRIATILDGLADSELARLESILEQFEQPTPGEQFALEKIDDNWSLEEQTKLEYSFYEQSPLRNLGELQSVKCKTQLCQIRVQVPKYIKLKPSYYMDWLNPVSVELTPSASDKDSRMIEIYLARE